MIRIAICDDEKNIRTYLSSLAELRDRWLTWVNIKY